ncbi:MAG: type II toxin-antitoxin system VapC family toxin [Phycisphaeraceae bacterium]|nr:type II toxin-antitoxin system VapC family toxin [Phycisphaeraceae bacterium]MBX3390287.1 type II toxin-antitoxin system VapC family toxin [Phycisphaeraceae bacterium]
MSAAFVLDCSTTLTWLFDEEATPETGELLSRLQEEAAVVPGLWMLEIANALAMAEKRKRSTPAQSDKFLKMLSALDIDVDHEFASRAFGPLLSLCRAHGLTSYDAAYLDLAARRRLPLATMDKQLATAARKLKIAVLG